MLRPGGVAADAGLDLGDDFEEDASPRARALRALREIEFDRATGKLSDQDYGALHAKYTGLALEALREQAPAPASGAPSRAPGPPSPPARALSCPTDGPRPEADAVFCSVCGRRLERAPGFCARCGGALEDGAHFCSRCGTRVAA